MLFSQPIQTVSLSLSAGAVSRWTCSGEGAMQPLRQAETQRPQSVQGSQSLTRFGRVKIASPKGQMSLQAVQGVRCGCRFQHCLRLISGWVVFISASMA